MGDKEHTNRPDDSDFKQQRLKAWQPILTPCWVIGTFVFVAVLFYPLGAYLLAQSNGVFESIQQYDGSGNLNLNCNISEQLEGYHAIENDQPMKCSLEFTILDDIAAGDDLFLYYQLDNFYQNHRRYVKSRSDSQLQDSQSVEYNSASLQTDCDPEGSYNSTTTGLIYFPCGLIATSYFNDGFQLEKFKTAAGKEYNYNQGIAESPQAPTLNFNDIAWSSDMEKKFMNPTGVNWNNKKYQYLWQTYSQWSCYNNITWARQNCTKYTGGTNPGDFGCRSCDDANSVPILEGGVFPPNGPETYEAQIANTDYTGSQTATYGIRTQHFVVWLRTAGLPDFRKLYAQIEPATDTSGLQLDWKKGDKLTFRVVPNFEVDSFNGKKSLVVATTSALGGKNNLLGIAYLTVASICLALAIIFAIKHKVSPRKLGDTEYLVWKKKP